MTSQTPETLSWWSLTGMRLRRHRKLVKRHYPLPVGAPPHSKGVIAVNAREGQRQIIVYKYCGVEIAGAAPVIIHLSGRGFCVKSHGIDDDFLHCVARDNSTFLVLDVEYRLAPEYPFPAALEDVEDVLEYLRGHPDKYDLTHLAICGFGAGGNLALAMAISSPPDTFETAVVFYPITDMWISEKRKIQLMDPRIRDRMRRGTGGVMPLWVMDTTLKCYLRGHPRNIVMDVRVSPGRQQDMTRFPRRCFFITCEGDPWALEARTLATGLMGARRGTPAFTTVRVMEIPGVGHAWDKYRKLDTHGMQLKNMAYNEAARFLRREIDP